MNGVVVYASVHHGNTKKVAEAVAVANDMELIDITKAESIDLSAYEVVGLASGVYYHSLHEKIKALVETTSFAPEQKVFTITTCGIGYRNYASGVAKTLKERGVRYLGNYQCRGYDTFGPFGKIGGIAKGRPNATDLEKAVAFSSGLLNGK